MNREEIIAFIFNDPEHRLERFCKSLTASQVNGDWKELQSIVLERLCSLSSNQVEDLWKQKEGFTAQAIWIWLHRTAKIQAHGNRTNYQSIVLTPKVIRVEDDFFDEAVEPEDLSTRQEFEDKLKKANDQFNHRMKKFTRLERVILETYMVGGMNGSKICKQAGVPYAFYMSKLSNIKRIVRECMGVEEEIPKTLLGVAEYYQNITDVPNWRTVKATFISRERKRYRQPTLFPIKQFLPAIYRKIKIA